MNRGGAQVEGYDVFVGGELGGRGSIARRVGVRVAADEAAPALERLFTAYIAGRTVDERFGTWANRVTDAAVRAALEGTAQEHAA
jgi:ferredoxin-nitrite reductase